MSCALNQPDHPYSKMVNGDTYEQQNLRGINLLSQAVSTSTFVTGVALSVIGLLKVSVFPLLVGLTAVYFSYNVYQACQNNKEIIENPRNYVSVVGTVGNMFSSKSNPVNFSLEKVRNQLSKNTFYFEWAIDLFLTVK